MKMTSSDLIMLLGRDRKINYKILNGMVYVYGDRYYNFMMPENYTEFTGQAYFPCTVNFFSTSFTQITPNIIFGGRCNINCSNITDIHPDTIFHDDLYISFNTPLTKLPVLNVGGSFEFFKEAVIIQNGTYIKKNIFSRSRLYVHLDGVEIDGYLTNGNILS